jgi:hypothetical protein
VGQWVVARPANSVLGLLLVASLPIVGMLSSTLIVLLILSVGFQRALLVAAAVAVLLAVAATFGGNPPQVVVVSMAAMWAPGIILASTLLVTRSFALTLQLSVLALAALLMMFYLSVSDPAAFWTVTLQQVANEWAAQGQQEMAVVVTQLLPFASQLTLVMSLSLWVVHAGLFTLGYALHEELNDGGESYGRFADLNFGKLIALTMAVISLAALPLDSELLSSLGFLLYAVFWLQGLAVLHWLVQRGKLPKLVVYGVYGCLLFLPLTVIALLLLALLGYTDAWFGFRRERTQDAA